MVPGINTLVVVGAGNMGRQIALCAALAGYRVRCTDLITNTLRSADQFASDWLAERVAKGKLTDVAAKDALANLTLGGSLEDAAVDADFVIEAIVERIDEKGNLFAQLDEICPAHTILTTNSSSFVSSRIASRTKRPGQVCNMHFFNPALVMKLVEVVKGTHTSPQTVETTVALAKSFGKIPVLLKREIDGFLVNRIVAAIFREALFLHDVGVASLEDIDVAVVHGLGHPMGPFRLLDLVGIDVTYDVEMERYGQTGDPTYKPSPTLVAKYARREWGEKSGKGFYEYGQRR